MESHDIQVFEDPALKAAVRRCCICECASTVLRRRVAGAIRSERIDSGSSMRMSTGAMAGPAATSWWASFGPSLAIAASLLIVIGSVGYLLSTSSQTLPRNLELAAVTRHDLCCQHADHRKIPRESFPEIGQYLRQELNHPVLAADLKRDGWTFRGAAICPVGDVKSAHMLFQKDNRTLSVFSLPSSACPALASNQTYEGIVNNHSVIARRENGAIYCLVSHCPRGGLSVPELDRILAAHEAEATVAAAPGPRVTVAGITREP
jgi:hypothetical protein